MDVRRTMGARFGTSASALIVACIGVGSGCGSEEDPGPTLAAEMPSATAAPGAAPPGATMPGVTAPGSTPGATAPGATVPGVTTPGAAPPDATGPDATTPGVAAPTTMVPMEDMPGAPPTSAPTDEATAGSGAEPVPDEMGGMDPAPQVGDPSQWNDPGTEPFVPVPEADVAAECKLDIGMLQSSGYRNGAVFRYGKLCYSNGSINSPYGVFSVTKTVAGTVMAGAYWETRENDRRILPSDPVSEWGGSGSTRISEYASMVAGGGSGRQWGSHRFAYDTLGSNLARTGSPMERSLAQGSVSGATSLAAVRDNVFGKLGVRGRWPTTTWGTGANISLTDMGRIGIALIHGGWYNGEQVLDPDWVYWMTHPPWEDANTSYGMYTWLNHRGNATGIGGDLSAQGQGPSGGDPCAPAAIWQSYPHPPSEATDCRPEGGASCEQMHDTGVFSAQGLGGQFIVGHRGLDLVLVARNFSNAGGPLGMWELVRPALVALDPMFMGDEDAFCEAYGSGNYAPDLLVPPVQPDAQ